jgi:hypothetical protein
MVEVMQGVTSWQYTKKKEYVWNCDGKKVWLARKSGK